MIGVVGYVLIEDFSPFDALYQTVLTLTTVGFQEVHPLSREARAFTIFLMVFGVGTALYLLTAIATLVLEGDVYRDIGERRKRRMIDQMSGHTIFVGAGRMGSRLASDAVAAGRSIVVIDDDGEAVERARERGWPVIKGDAEVESVLTSANVAQASRLYVVTGDDSVNALIAFRAKELSPDVHIATRCNDPDNARLMRRIGANEILSPVDMIAASVTSSIANGE